MIGCMKITLHCPWMYWHIVLPTHAAAGFEFAGEQRSNEIAKFFLKILSKILPTMHPNWSKDDRIQARS